MNGISKLERCTGTEYLHRKQYEVPSIIVTYKMFMNGVDIMDNRHEKIHGTCWEDNDNVYVHFFLGSWCL